MPTIKQITCSDSITQITLDIMMALPEWFSPPEDIQKKSILHRDYPFFVAYDGDVVVGFLALKNHSPFTAEIFNLAVLKTHHRVGIGRLLLEAAEAYCRACGYVYLTVKTLDASANYQPYEQTRAFYYKNGFLPLEVLTAVWNPENPCLLMIKAL